MCDPNTVMFQHAYSSEVAPVNPGLCGPLTASIPPPAALLLNSHFFPFHTAGRVSSGCAGQHSPGRLMYLLIGRMYSEPDQKRHPSSSLLPPQKVLQLLAYIS